MKGLQHEAINVRKGIYTKKGIYHIQHVNEYHTRLKKWMNRFQGVVTKYLDNSLFCHRFLELNKKLPFQEKVKECCSVPFNVQTLPPWNTLEGQHKKERLLHSVLINSVIVNCRYFYLHF